MKSKEKNIVQTSNGSVNADKFAKYIVVIIPTLVVLGSFYNSGQGSVFGDVYFSSIGYQDTLLQLFIPLRTIVFLFSIVLSIFVLLLLFLFALSFLDTVATIVNYKIKQRKRFKKYKKNEVFRRKTLQDIENLTVAYASENDVPESVLQKIEDAYVSTHKWRNADLHGVDIYNGFVENMKAFLKRSYKESDDDSERNIKSWFKKSDKNLLSISIFMTLLAASAIAVIYNFWKTDTIYLSFIILGFVSLLYVLLFAISWFNNSKTNHNSPFNIFMGFMVIFCVSSIFMFSLGRDEAQSAILNSDTYDVIVDEGVFSGRLIASNHSGILLIEEGELSYVRWRTIQYIERSVSSD